MMVNEAQQVSEAIIVSVGTIITLTLMVNAYFTRKTLEKINAVDVKLAIIITEHDNTKEKADQNERAIKEMQAQHSQERDQMMRYISNSRERLSVLEAKEKDKPPY